MYAIFKIFYDHGWLAVDLFFLLSGFIFFWLYSERISVKAISVKDFFVLRLSRLYPLHVLTLVVTALGQVAFAANSDTAQSFVYAHNDVYHLMLNVFMSSSIGLERGYSFNGPFWSVSIEALLYLIFFIFSHSVVPLLTSKAKLTIALTILVCAGVYLTDIYAPIGRGMTSFFLGGLLYILFTYVTATQVLAKRILHISSTLAITSWVCAFAFVYLDIQISDITPSSQIGDYINIYARFWLFPLTVFSLALLDVHNNSSSRYLSSLGDISYSSYLWHFPLQLALITIANRYDIDNSLFNSWIALFMFFIALILISHWSYAKIEAPAQAYLRSKWLTRREPESPVTQF